MHSLRRLRFPRALQQHVQTIIKHCRLPLQLAAKGHTNRRDIHRFFRQTGDAGVEAAILALADHAANEGSNKPDSQDKALLQTVNLLLEAFFCQREAIVSPPPLLTGEDLLETYGLRAGPQVGRMMADLLEAQAAGEVGNREQAKAWVENRLSG
jgi:poly(A) polymerase